jgi:hypothetical protein
VAIALLFAWMILLVMCVKVWAEHPAEQPIGYEEHMEYIRNLGDTDVLS